MNTQLPDILRSAGAIGDIKPDSRLREDLDMDSLDRADLAMQLERELSTDISDEAIESWVTVQDVEDFIKAGERA